MEFKCSEEKRQLALKQVETVREFSEKPGTSPELKDCLRILGNAWELIAKSHDKNYGMASQQTIGMQLMDLAEKSLDRILAKEKEKENGLQPDLQ